MQDTHDYSGGKRRFGHDYTVIKISDDGKDAALMGWGFGVKEGDYLIIDGAPNNTTRYQVKSIKYRSDPRDMWSARVAFAPRATAQGAAA